ncbi:hypothetical protein GCM10022255_037210 [Dactylosporangium darangshiense]|uniref:Uncharacterized protein n=1 Tax=Dactylosporangium darangshiense TaxID=579108 RepID=A0ABP8D8Q6_9ACTN
MQSAVQASVHHPSCHQRLRGACGAGFKTAAKTSTGVNSPNTDGAEPTDEAEPDRGLVIIEGMAASWAAPTGGRRRIIDYRIADNQ